MKRSPRFPLSPCLGSCLGLAALLASLSWVEATAHADDLAVPSAMTDSDWQKNSGVAVPERYQIVKGDTLWGLSKRFFGDGQGWPKLYEWNKDTVSNPDLIYTGKWLVFVPGTGTTLPQLTDNNGAAKAEVATEEASDTEGKEEGGETVAEAKPENKENNDLEESTGDVEDTDILASGSETLELEDDEESDPRRKKKSLTVDSIRTGSAKPRSKEWKKLPTQSWEYARPSLPKNVDKQGFSKDNHLLFSRDRGFELPAISASAPLTYSGEIIAARSPSPFISLGDTVYLRADSEMSLGMVFAVVPDPNPLSGNKQDHEGYSYPIYGKIRITGIRDSLYIGTVVGGANFIARGAHLIPVPPKVPVLKPIGAEATVEATIMVDRTLSTGTTAQHKFVFFDRGSEDGVKPGNIFRMYEHYDKHNDNLITNEDFISDGDAMVIQASEHYCIALLIRSTVTINDGAPGILLTDVSEFSRSNATSLPVPVSAPPSESTPPESFESSEAPPTEDTADPAAAPAPVPPAATSTNNAADASANMSATPPQPASAAKSTPPAPVPAQPRGNPAGPSMGREEEDLDKLDDGNGLGKDEQKELRQLEKWKGNPTPPAAPVAEQHEAVAPPPPPAPQSIPANPAGAPSGSGEALPPPPPPPIGGAGDAMPPPSPGSGGSQAPVDESKALDQLLNQ